jgi:hypothetical protein
MNSSNDYTPDEDESYDPIKQSDEETAGVNRSTLTRKGIQSRIR